MTGKFAKNFFIFLIISAWIFSGWSATPFLNFPPKIQVAQATTETFITAGTFTNGWTAPAGVFSVTAETWGGGGGSGGGTSTSLPGGSGGGGGAYASKVISVTPGNSYTYVVGAAGLKDGGTAGGDSSFTGDASVQSLACGGTSGAVNGGTAGAGGTILCSDGTAEFAGGAGAAGAGTSGGGGGESAGTTAIGGDASGTTGGTGTDGTDGSAGQLIGVNGVAGNNPGAGAGGSGRRSGGNEQGASGGVGQVRLTYVAITAALTGTVTASITEADIVAGGKTIILTVTGDTWVASGATFDGQRQNIINGIDSAQAEATGWDAEVKAKEVVGAVVRTSNTVVTITLSAQIGYNITATETITATIPATALSAGNAIVATPTFDITAAAAPTLTFSISDNAIGFGTLLTTAAQWATGDSSGSASEASAHTMAASTNAINGYTITVNGNTLTHTNPSFTINAIGASATDVTVGTGTEQFGIRLTALGGNGAVSSPYNGASNNYALDTVGFPDQVASDADGDDISTTYSVFYAANIASGTEAGSYSATLTYVVTGNL